MSESHPSRIRIALLSPSRRIRVPKSLTKEFKDGVLTRRDWERQRL